MGVSTPSWSREVGVYTHEPMAGWGVQASCCFSLQHAPAWPLTGRRFTSVHFD